MKFNKICLYICVFCAIMIRDAKVEDRQKPATWYRAFADCVAEDTGVLCVE